MPPRFHGTDGKTTFGVPKALHPRSFKVTLADMVDFGLLFFAASIAAGATASVTGFGIGSLLTPLLAYSIGTKSAVVAVALPHLIATFIRFWIVRAEVSRKVLISFGITSAIGGLIGALVHTTFQSIALARVFGALLIFAGFTGMTGLAQKMRLHGPLAWIGGMLSGGFGGLVGNQGGIRSAALMTFGLSKESLVATSTAIGILVDFARVPVYLVSEGRVLSEDRGWIALATLGVVLGTLVGIRFLRKMSDRQFRRVLGLVILLLGVYMMAEAARAA